MYVRLSSERQALIYEAQSSPVWLKLSLFIVFFLSSSSSSSVSSSLPWEPPGCQAGSQGRPTFGSHYSNVFCGGLSISKMVNLFGKSEKASAILDRFCFPASFGFPRLLSRMIHANQGWRHTTETWYFPPFPQNTLLSFFLPRPSIFSLSSIKDLLP